jgi:hypothetical protein
MEGKAKRTYNLRASTVARVRELSADYGVADSQDAVVELAIDRLYSAAIASREADIWAAAAEDAEFAREMRAVAREFQDSETWPR